MINLISPKYYHFNIQQILTIISGIIHIIIFFFCIRSLKSRDVFYTSQQINLVVKFHPKYLLCLDFIKLTIAKVGSHTQIISDILKRVNRVSGFKFKLQWDCCVLLSQYPPHVCSSLAQLGWCVGRATLQDAWEVPWASVSGRGPPGCLGSSKGTLASPGRKVSWGFVIRSSRQKPIIITDPTMFCTWVEVHCIRLQTCPSSLVTEGTSFSYAADPKAVIGNRASGQKQVFILSNKFFSTTLLSIMDTQLHVCNTCS